jgi:hypothetical protein
MSQSKPVVKPRSQRKPVEVDLGFNWGTTNTVLLALGLGMILAGYFALSRGSITLAPLLLVAGYVIVVPAALVLLGKGKTSGE